VLNKNGSRDGPYEVATIPSAGNCTLSQANGGLVNNGDVVDVDTLQRDAY